MSNQAITWALETHTGGPATKVLLIAIANYANADNESYPSIERLAEETDQSRASVKRHLNTLVEMGLIERIQRGDKTTGGRLTNRYVLLIPVKVRAQIEPGVTDDNTNPLAQPELGVMAQSEPGGLGLSFRGVRAQSEGGLGSPVSPEPKEPSEPKNNVRSLPPKPDRFDEFYAMYPRHDGVDAARKRWAQVIKTADAQEIINGAKAFRALCERERTERKFIALPATWLNAGRWKDESLTQEAPEPRYDSLGFLL